MPGGKGVRLASGDSVLALPPPSIPPAGLGLALTVFHVSDKRQGQQHRSQMEAEALEGPGGNEVSKEEALLPSSPHPTSRSALLTCRRALAA